MPLRNRLKIFGQRIYVWTHWNRLRLLAPRLLGIALVAGGLKSSWQWIRKPEPGEWAKLLVPVVVALVASAGAAAIVIWQVGSQLEAGRSLQDERAKEDALQSYLGRMTQLLLDISLREPSPTPTGAKRATLTEEAGNGSLSGTVLMALPQLFAREHTIRILKDLKEDPNRKQVVMTFLLETRLIDRDFPLIVIAPFETPPRRTFLQDADLKDIDLSGLVLSKFNLHGANSTVPLKLPFPASSVSVALFAPVGVGLGSRNDISSSN